MKNTVISPCVSPSRASVLSFAHYFQAPATQAIRLCACLTHRVFVYFADPNTLRYFYNLGFQVCISTDTLSWTANLRADFHCRVKFTIANRIEAMYERSHVSVKVEPCSTSRFISTLFILPLFCVRDKNLRALMCVAKNALVEINLKGAVSWQSSSFCLILPLTRPQSLWNLK